MESIQELKDIINQQNSRIQQLENLLKIQQFSYNNHDTIQTPIVEVKHSNNENNIVFEYICLACNQQLTSKDILHHSQQNKDHIDHCIDIDSIKKQLLDINSNSCNNNNNIFKKRIETLWSSLKRLSTTHSLLNSKINEISNHFKILYDYLISKEHSLKKPIQNDIDSANNDIIKQINELKSIIKIININNTLHNFSSGYGNIDNYSDDTTDKYTISPIIESIQQSKSYIDFIENNKNTLFYYNHKELKNNNFPFLLFIETHNSIFNSSLLNPTEINSQSIYFNENLYIVKVKQKDYVCNQLQALIEESIIINETPSGLIKYGDLDIIKQYYKRNVNKLEYNHKIKSDQQNEIKETIIEILKSNRIDILEYFFKELHFDIKTKFKLDTQLTLLRIGNFDLLTMSTIYSNLETIQFIESFGIINNIKWNYEICLEVSPFSNNIKILQYFSSKVIGIIGPDSINNIYVSANAALLGHIDMIEWISTNTTFSFKYQNTRYSGSIEYCIDIAAKNGHLDIIKWLHENRTEVCRIEAMDNAAQNGHLETIKWLHHNRTEGCTTYAIDFAAMNGHFETIKWLHENRTEGCTTHAMDYAAENGDLETIKWLHENRTEGCTTYAIDSAAKNGHLETIKWLHENRTEGCTTNAMNNAAENGHLEIMKWLGENRTV